MNRTSAAPEARRGMSASTPAPRDSPLRDTADRPSAVQVAAWSDPLEAQTDHGGTAVQPQGLMPVPQAVEDALRQSTGRGRPLPAALRHQAQSRLGPLPTEVRIVADAEAPAMLGTRAFAFGNDVYLSPQAPRIDSPDAEPLLMHELAHVVQQQRAGRSFIQREDPKRRVEGPWVIYDLPGGLSQRVDDRDRRVEVWAGDKPWVTVQGPRSAPLPRVEITRGFAISGPKQGEREISIRVDTEADIDVQVDEDVQEAVIESAGDRSKISYALKGGGSATFSHVVERVVGNGALYFGPDGLPVKVSEEASRKFPLPLTMSVTSSVTDTTPSIRNSDTLPGQVIRERGELITLEKIPDSFPPFNSKDELRKFLERSPNKNFVILTMPDGKLVAREINEEQLKRLARSARGASPDLGSLTSVTRYKGQAAEAEFLTFWLRGQEYTSLNSLSDLYYDDETQALAGARNSASECVVYRMGNGSFGRKPLTHDDATRMMLSFDRMTKDEVFRHDVDGAPFVLLRLAGRSGLHEVDDRYFDGRDKFTRNAARLDRLDMGSDELLAVYDEADSMASRHFLQIELDRDVDNAAFISMLGGTTRAQALVGKNVWRQVADHGNFVAAREIDKGIGELVPYAENESRLKNMVLGFGHLKPENQKQALDFFGVPESDQPSYTRVLGDPGTAGRVFAGETVEDVYQTLHTVVTRESSRVVTQTNRVPISLDSLRVLIRAQIANLHKFVDLLKSRDTYGELEFTALSASGDFGQHIREITYRDFGMRLDPKAFPHGNVSPGSFPNALAGHRSQFVSTFEQIYANESNRHDTWEFISLVGKITLMAAAAVALMLVASLAGLGAVAFVGLFNIELSAGAAFALSTGVTSLVLTGADLAQAKVVEGRDPTLEKAIETYAENVVMITAFAGLGKVLKGLAAPARLAVTGGTFLTFSLGKKLLTDGGFKSTRDVFLWFYENVITFAAMEATAPLMRSLDLRVGIWARARRLGVMAPEISAHSDALRKLFSRQQDLLYRPHLAAHESAALEVEVNSILKQHSDLAEKSAALIKNRNDPEAKFVDEELAQVKAEIEKALAGMRAAGFLEKLQLKPVEGVDNAFEYKPAADAETRVKQFYPEGTRVEATADGVISVQLAGEDAPFVLYPEGHAKLPLAKAAPTAGKLNLNVASLEDIVAADIPGIKEGVAKRIVEGRDARGSPFGGIDELIEIKGIGKATLDALKASGKVEVSSRPAIPLEEISADLKQRADAVLARADRVGVSDPALEAIRKLRVKGATDVKVAAARTLVDKAEKVGNAKADAAGKGARNRLTKRSSMPSHWLSEIKVGRLANVPDATINDALTQIPLNYKGLGPQEIRAIVLAYTRNVNIAKFLVTAQGASISQRRNALRLYVDAAETGIAGVDVVLQDMTKNAGSFNGGLWQLQVAEDAGLRNLSAFEREIDVNGTERELDIVLKGANGVWIECKNWGKWYGDSGKLADQFRKDVRLRNYNPDTFNQLKYVFKKPMPVSIELARQYFRTALVDELTNARQSRSITASQEQALLAAFDAKPDLVIETALRDERQLSPADPALLPTRPTIIVPRTTGDGKDDSDDEVDHPE